MTVAPWLDDGDVRLYHGDCLEVLRGLPDRSVHMCATSPPFYGLRDYGTGEWEGGDLECDHQRPSIPGKDSTSTLESRASNQNHEREPWPKGVCGKCGARRVDRQIGLEETPDEWVNRLVDVFREVRRVLRDDGTLWVEIGDSYASGGLGAGGTEKQASNAGANLPTAKKAPPGYKSKDLLGQPWLLAFALRADGWYLRSEIIWARPNPMPESVTDRPTKSHSTVFLLSKSPRYFYDTTAIAEPSTYPEDDRKARANGSQKRHPTEQVAGIREGSATYATRNARSVWQIATEPTPFQHFATWPRKLVARMIQAGTSERGCCPECGAPWVRNVEIARGGPSDRNGSRFVGDAGPVGTNYTGKAFGSDTRGAPSKTVTTLGWSPSCAHDHAPIPCTVLDPFAGSGTTNLVARHHGRHSIGIELNEQYLKIAADRLAQLSLLTGAGA